MSMPEFDLDQVRVVCRYWTASTFLNDEGDPKKFTRFLYYSKTFLRKSSPSLRREFVNVCYEENFAETAIRAMKWLSENGMFSSETHTAMSALLYLSMTDFTDTHLPFGVAIVEAGVVPYLLDILTRYHDSCVQSTNMPREVQLVNNSLGILHNVSLQPALARTVREAGGKQVLQKYVDNNSGTFLSGFNTVLPMFCLAYIATDEDMKELNDDYGIVELVVGWLKAAFQNERHSTEFSWEAKELTAGLARLAVNDDNKQKVFPAIGRVRWSSTISTGPYVQIGSSILL